MLLLLLLICLLTSAVVALRRRDKLSLLFVALNLANGLMIAGVVIYIAGMGGTAASKTTLLFFFNSWRRYLRALPISMDSLGYAVVLGRLLVPYFALLLGLQCSMHPLVLRWSRLWKLLSFIPIFLLAIFYHPRIFRPFMRAHFDTLIHFIAPIYVLLLLYLILAFGLLLLEYRLISISFFKRSFRYMLLCLLSSILLYLPYASKDPSQIYNYFISEYIELGLSSYISPSLGTGSWVLLLLVTLFGALSSSWFMLRYTEVDYQESRKDLILKQKYDLVGSGVSIFVHGIKNQILSNQVLLKRLRRQLAQPEPELGQLREIEQALEQLNQSMLAHMDSLYQSIRKRQMRLERVRPEQLVDLALRQLRQKSPEAEVRVEIQSRRDCLVDPHYFAEALYNLLLNGYEACQERGRLGPDCLSLRVHDERLWTVFQIQDRAGGIAPELRRRMYEPFVTAKNSNYNWGLGLYSVRKTVQDHLGRIRFESQEGEGSCFYLLLPRLDGPSQVELGGTAAKTLNSTKKTNEQ